MNLCLQPGSAILLNTGHATCKHIIMTPTMVIPSTITNKEIIYWCIWNIFNITRINGIKTIVLPALGTGCGNISNSDFVKLVYIAYRNYEKNTNMTTISWEYASNQYNELRKILRSMDNTDLDIRRAF